MTPMPYPRLRRSVAGLTLGLVLVSGPQSYAYDDYSYGSGADSYDSGRSTRSLDPSEPDEPTSQAPTYGRTLPPAPGSGVPFGLNKSTAGAIAGALLGAGSGAIKVACS